MKIFCVGRNYSEHAKELGNEVPEEPVIFLKPESALVTLPTIVGYPNFTKDLHYETEVVLRISKSGKNIPLEDAMGYFDAIGLGIDFTARDVQAQLKKKGLPWEKSKAWDGSAVVSELLPIGELVGKGILNNGPDFDGGIPFSLTKNTVVVQKGNTHDMIFSFGQIISNISVYFCLEVGDLVYTGTPAGVGPCIIGDVLEGFLGHEKMFVFSIA